MLPDLLVVVLKVRDYALWFGPPYLVALGISAVLQMLVHVRANAGSASATRVANPNPGAVGRDLSAVPVTAPAGRAALVRALWWRSLATGLTPAALLLPGYLNVLLLVARAGGTLAVSPFMAAGAAWLGDAPAAVLEGGGTPPAAPPPVSAALPLRARLTLTWRYFRDAVDAEFHRFLLGGVIGGLVVAWAPGLWLGEQLGGSTLSAAVFGALLGLALPLNGGTVMPVMAALITRGAGPAAMTALLVTAPLLNWWDLRPLVRHYSWRSVLVYVSIGVVGASLLGFALAQLPGSARLGNY